MRIAVILALLAALRPVAGSAIEAGTYDYRISHSLHGDIGYHRMHVSPDEAGKLIVEHEFDVEIRMLSALLYYRDGKIREVWDQDRIDHFNAVIDDDGEILEVAVRRDGDALLVEGIEGTLRAPADAAPSQPSFEGAIERPIFFEIETGTLIEAEIAKVELDGVEIEGARVPATKYTLAGDRADRIWFAEDGVWVKWELDVLDGLVTLVLE